MSSTGTTTESASETPAAPVVDMKLEVVVVPVSDVDRAKRFYGSLGWRLDADFPVGDDFRVVQLTPPGSDASIIFGDGVTAAAAERGSYGSFASFDDPDGSGWVLQEVTTRLPGRVTPAPTAFASASDLARALRRAAAAHGARTGEADAEWPAWYAEYMVSEQAGEELPT